MRPRDRHAWAGCDSIVASGFDCMARPLYVGVAKTLEGSVGLAVIL